MVNPNCSFFVFFAHFSNHCHFIDIVEQFAYRVMLPSQIVVQGRGSISPMERAWRRVIASDARIEEMLMHLK
jgi:hypothetical protein